MPYCSIVEFEWDETFDHEQFAGTLAVAGDVLPDGCLSRISSIDDTGARMIEVWRSGDVARAFAEQSKPFLAGAALHAPSRVSGFQVTSYQVA